MAWSWQDPLELADPARSQAHVACIVDRGEARYCASKLLNLMHVRHLARELPAAGVVAFNPSVVPGTEIGRDRTWLQQLGWKYVMPLLAPILPGARGLGRSAGDLVWLITEADVAQLSGHTWTAGCRRRASRTIWRRSRGRWRWRVILGRFVEPVGSLAPD